MDHAYSDLLLKAQFCNSSNHGGLELSARVGVPIH